MIVQVVYIDVFFVYNFLIDAFLLYVTGKLLKRRITFKIALGAMAGALYSSLCMVIEIFSLLPLRLLILYLMIKLSFKGSTLKLAGVFFLVSFAFCGLLLSLSFMLGGNYIILDGSPIFVSGYALLLFCMFVFLLFAFLTVKYLIKKLTLREICKEVEITRGGKKVVLNALVDTGLNLFDYENKCPVILVNEEKIDLSVEEIRTMGISTVSGEDFLLCVNPEIIEIEKKKYRVTPAIPKEKITGYDALLNADLFISEAEYV